MCAVATDGSTVGGTLFFVERSTSLSPATQSGHTPCLSGDSSPVTTHLATPVSAHSRLTMLRRHLLGILTATATTGATDDSSSLTPLNTLADECPAVHFPVPLFGGQLGSNHTLTSSYAAASNDAHIVLGLLLFAMVIAWAAFVLEFIRVNKASQVSGGCQLGMGVYLLSWLFFFMHPSFPLDELFYYTTHDLLQLQHLAIALLLVAGGLIELMQAQELLPPMAVQMAALRANAEANSNGTTPSSPSPSSSSAAASASRSGSYWHLVWSTNLTLTGLVFMLHPQHTYAATVKHLLLGAALVIGAPLFIRAKSMAWKAEIDAIKKAGTAAAAAITTNNQRNTLTAIDAADPPPPVARSNYVDWSMIVAGGSFAIASCILLAFRETETEVHTGTFITCQPSFALCIMSYVTAGGSIVTATAVAAKNFWTARQAHHASASSAPSSTSSLRSSYTTLICCPCLPSVWRTNWQRLSQHDESDQSGEDRVRAIRIGRARSTLAEEEEEVEQCPASSLRKPTQFHAPASNSANAALRQAYAPTTVAMHTIGQLDGYGSEGEEEVAQEKEENNEKERQRDRRRQEQYTGEEQYEHEEEEDEHQRV